MTSKKKRIIIIAFIIALAAKVTEEFIVNSVQSKIDYMRETETRFQFATIDYTAAANRVQDTLLVKGLLQSDMYLGRRASDLKSYLRALINLEILGKKMLQDTLGANNAANARWARYNYYENNNDINGLEQYIQEFNFNLYSVDHQNQTKFREILSELIRKKALKKSILITIQIVSLIVAFYEKINSSKIESHIDDNTSRNDYTPSPKSANTPSRAERRRLKKEQEGKKRK